MAVLRFGDKGDPVKAFQRNLNKIGALLLVDGDFGTATRDAIPDARGVTKIPGGPDADDALQAALVTLSDPCPPLTSAGVTFIARAEISSPATYRQSYCHPTWPSAQSGITIGIGYDLQFRNEGDFRRDWGGRLTADCLTQLLPALGEVGSDEVLDRVRDLVVPLPAAVGAFISRSLPLFLTEARGIYPQLDGLATQQRTALVSLVYNRGPRLTDNNPTLQDRREMRAIQQLLADGDLDAVPAQFESMTRLWDPAKLPGLIQRRRDEATMWRSGFPALMLG